MTSQSVNTVRLCLEEMTTAASQRSATGGARSRNRRVVTSDNDRPPITRGEAALIALIPTKYSDKPWITDTGDMPSLIRPSSAAANLQTHPCYTSGLFDSCPSASPVSDGGKQRFQRPKTGGTRARRHGRPGDKKAPWKHERRLTLTGVEAISQSHLLGRRTFVDHKLNAGLKLKVRTSTIRVYFTSRGAACRDKKAVSCKRNETS